MKTGPSVLYLIGIPPPEPLNESVSMAENMRLNRVGASISGQHSIMKLAYYSNEFMGQFTLVLALYDPFVVDVPLNFDITHSPHRPQ